MCAEIRVKTRYQGLWRVGVAVARQPCKTKRPRGLIQMQHTSTCSRAGEQGFSLIEAMVAITLLSVTLVSLAHLFVAATRATMTSRQVTRAVILAEQKMEQLHAVAWATESDGSPVSDFTSNLAAFTATGACAGAATGAAVGLTPSPAGALEGNIDGYVDYVDAQGCGLGGGAVPPPGSVYVRRWSIAAVGCWTRHAAAAGAGDGSRAAADHDRRRRGRPPAGRGDARRREDAEDPVSAVRSVRAPRLRRASRSSRC